jgi:septation ring formation regulator EzrA
VGHLQELLTPERVIAAVAAVVIGLLGILGWAARGWKSYVEDELKDKPSKGALESARENAQRVENEVRALIAKLEREVALIEERFLAAVQRAAGAFRDVAALHEGLERLRAEVEKVRETVHLLESRHAIVAGLEADVERLDAQLAELRQRMETGEPS